MDSTVSAKAPEYRGRAFLGFHEFSRFTRPEDAAAHVIVLATPELSAPIPADEIIVSWNVEAPAGTGLKVEARACSNERWTKWYALGRWSKDGKDFPRESVKGQKDDDGDVSTDTLVLKAHAQRFQVRVTLQGDAAKPNLKYIGVSLADSKEKLEPLPPNKAAWGKDLPVPQRQQSGYPGADGWCSPTSVTMMLAFWSETLKRPELNLPVPEVAHAIYDRVFNGTGNWPFNTAFAGEFPGLRAYVTRFSDARELEDWIAAGLPVIVSVASGLISGDPTHIGPGHLMVCVGFAENGDIVLNDPAARLDKGQSGRKVFKRADFLTAWKASHYTVYLVYPEGHRLPENVYGHWE